MRSYAEFMSHVLITPTCWLWRKTSGEVESSYGFFRFGKECSAHRVAWYFATGRFSRKQILHKCDTPACVRPDHLFEGSQADNIRDMRDKGRLIIFPNL